MALPLRCSLSSRGLPASSMSGGQAGGRAACQQGGPIHLGELAAAFSSVRADPDRSALFYYEESVSSVPTGKRSIGDPSVAWSWPRSRPSLTDRAHSEAHTFEGGTWESGKVLGWWRPKSSVNSVINWRIRSVSTHSFRVSLQNGSQGTCLRVVFNVKWRFCPWRESHFCSELTDTDACHRPSLRVQGP